MRATAYLLFLAACCLTACDYGGEEGQPAAVGCGEPVETVIDTGEQLELEPGEGVGVFVEHLGDGEWRVRTTCDTNQSGTGCSWDLLIAISPLGEGELYDFSTESFDEGDAVGYEQDGSLHAVVHTEGDLDGVTFFATPGAPLRFDALLDGYCAHPYVYWIGGGAVHTGSPTNPVDFTPSE